MLSELTERVTFKAPNKVDNGRGGYTIDEANPVVIGTLWAKVEIVSKAKVMQYQGQRLESNIYITIRENPAINTSCKAFYNGMELDVNEMTPTKKRGYIQLAASEVIK